MRLTNNPHIAGFKTLQIVLGIDIEQQSTMIVGPGMAVNRM